MMRLWILACIGLLWPLAAHAEVRIDFYSRDQGVRIPHAFVAMEGVLDDTGEIVSANYGFTANRPSPAVLFGPVPGRVMTAEPAYVGLGRRHFSLILSDAEYRQVMREVERWRALPQPAYDLDRRNCVSFLADLAATLGLEVTRHPQLMRRPRAFLQSLTRENAAVIAARSQARPHSSPEGRGPSG